MKVTRLIRTAAAVCTIAAATTAAASQDAWDRADDQLAASHYAEALQTYEQMAQAGDIRAAEVAGHMLLIGEALYGQEVRRDETRAMRLLALAAGEGRPVAMHLVKRVRLASAK